MNVARLVTLCGAIVLTTAMVLAAPQRATTPSGTPTPSASPAGASAGNVERGRYLVERVVMCGECHSTRDESGNIVTGTKFKGGPMVVRPTVPLDWPPVFPRIAGLPGYTDEQAMRLLTQGAIKRDGTQLRMPMPRFRMNPQDAADVVAYLRSQ
jgi:mono/diheme cytochrome c family protein